MINDNSLPQRSVVEELDPSLEEVHKAINQLVSNIAPGNDCITAEIFLFGGVSLVEKLHLFGLIWETSSLPQDFKDVSIIHLYKGDDYICDNHRVIPYFMLLLRFLLGW